MKTEIPQLRDDLEQAGYVADRPLATALVLLLRLGRPLLLEGDAGVGKTAVAKALAAAFDCALIRLQCYEGLDASAAVYEWNYPHQLLTLKIQEQSGHSPAEQEAQIFSSRFLLERPLLKAITQERPPVLLIDEVDRADEAFEAYLLEVLSDFQISIPELGTVTARSIPYVVLTSNATRELSDALRRRCLYHYLGYPDTTKELAIIKRQLPHIEQTLATQIVQFVQRLRTLDLRKKPGIAETLDWTMALLSLDIQQMGEKPQVIMDTLGALLKTQEDLARVDGKLLLDLLEQSP